VDRLEIGDGYLDLGGAYVERALLPNGPMAVVAVTTGVPVCIEIAVYGEVAWDGVERAWTIKYPHERQR
jgi:hypothetical protein